MRSMSTALAALSLSALVALPVAAQPLYKIKALPNTEEIRPKGATAINNEGVVVGFGTAPPYKATRCYRYDGTAPLMLNDNYQCSAVDVNASGDVLAQDALGLNGSVIWHPDGSQDRIDGLEAHALNDSAEVTGLRYWKDEYQPVLYREGRLIKLGSLGGRYGVGYGINNKSEITGFSHQADGSPRAFLWKKGVMKDLGTLGGSASVGMAINNHGLVVGAAKNAQEQYQGFSYDGTTMQPLPTRAGLSISPTAVNDDGVIVGRTEQGAAVIRDGRLFQLKEVTDGSGSEWDALTDAQGINDDGVIVGYGYLRGYRRAFIAKPIGR